MSLSVFIVDDSGFARLTVRNILEGAGHTIIGEAANGVEALDRIPKAKPDLITLDNILPDTNGIEILRSLRASNIQSRVIMISAVGQQSAIEEGLSVGAEAYLIKPFTAEKLLAEVKRLFEG